MVIDLTARRERSLRKWNRLFQWHRWFAWRPVPLWHTTPFAKVGAPSDRYAWFQFVWRRRNQCHWEYKEVSGENSVVEHPCGKRND